MNIIDDSVSLLRVLQSDDYDENQNYHTSTSSNNEENNYDLQITLFGIIIFTFTACFLWCW